MEQVVPVGISRVVDTYLDAHGYNDAAKLAVRHAWDSFDDVDDFVDYLSLKGMAKAEANWLFVNALLV